MGLGKKRKIGSKLPTPPGLPPMPSPPAPGMPLPPAPGMPLPPAPGIPLPAAPLPPAPAPAAQAAAPPLPENPLPAIEALPPSPSPQVEAVVEPEDDSESYSGLYAKKSGKPLQQVYGHIDRISQGDIGSLLDRYSDRFGHELDRDIIVMRKDERDDKIAEVRDSPTVKLLNQEEESKDDGSLDGETLVELNSQLKTVEDELRRIKPQYQAAKADGDREVLRDLRPSLEALMAERKLLKAVIAGEADIDELFQSESEEEYDEEEYEEDEEEYEEDEEEYDEEEYEEDEDIFVEFASIVDNLLGTYLTASEITVFSESEGFAIYQSVGSSPADASDDERSNFFSVVDTLLGQLSDEIISEFTSSAEFETYRTVGAMYS